MTLQIDRAQPLLGTLVSIRVRGLAPALAQPLINDAFAVVGEIHRLMSFHEADSDLSRLNRDACTKSVKVDRRTFEVLTVALELSARSGGVFDVAVGERLAAWGYLPASHLGPRPKAGASWRDIELLAGGRVRFHRPLWIDLGGIAKGYAVDAAIERLVGGGAAQVLVNAGGDLRVAGPDPERIFLRLPRIPSDGLVPAVDLTNAAMASSSGREHARTHQRHRVGPHIHARTRRPVGLSTFVSVVSDRCVHADGLTKIVLAKGIRSAAILKTFNATAYLHGKQRGWRTVGTPS